MTVDLDVSLPTLRPHTELVRGILPVLLCSLLWGAVGLVSVYAPAAASPESVGACGLLLAGLLMLATRPGARSLLLRAFGAAAPKQAVTSRRDTTPRCESFARERGLIVLGSFGLLCYPLAFLPAVRLLGVALATAVTLGSAPLFAGLIARFVQRRALGRRWLQCAPPAVAGTVMLVAGDGSAHSVSALGVVLALIPGLSYATASTVASVMIGSGHASKDVYGAMFGTCALWCLPVLAVGGIGWLFAARGMGVVLFFGCVTNFLCYTVFGNALRYTSAATATTVTLAEGAVGTLLGVFVHGERLAPAAWSGLVLLAVALLLLSLPKRAMREKRTER
jgi:DME family drug/metabolite transporter